VLAVPVAVAAAPIRVALLPIVVHEASGESEYLSTGLGEMLSARLEQAGGIQVLRLDSNSRTTSVDVAVEAGRAAGADFVVFGSFTQFGDGASLDMRCAKVPESGQPEARKVFVQSGQLGAIIPRLADVSRRIVHYLKGGTVPEAAAEAAGSPAGSESASDLERRVEALERAVFPSGSEEGGEAAPANE
jgi:hypothetical protein